MNSSEVKQNIKLGAFVLMGLVLFLVAVFFIGSENNVFNKTFTVHAVFRNVEGLKSGDNVWLSGVKIGTVREVHIVSLGRVVVSLSLKDKQNEFIKRNASASIGSDGLVGNKIVVIRPGDALANIQDQDTIGAYSPADTQELINIARDVGENTRSLTNDLRAISQRIRDGEGIVGELLADGAMAQEIRRTVSKIQTTSIRAAEATGELQAMVQELRHGDGLANRLITDTTLAQVFDQTLHHVQEVSRNSAAMSRRLQALTQRLDDGDNAIGLLLADTTFAGSMRVTLRNAQSASAKLDENMDALRHNFLLRGYFRRKDREAKRQQHQ